MVVAPCSCKYPLFYSQSHPHHPKNPNPNKPLFFCLLTNPRPRRRLLLTLAASAHPLPPPPPPPPPLKLNQTILGLSVSASATILFLTFGLRICSATSSPSHLHLPQRPAIQESVNDEVEGEKEGSDGKKSGEDEELRRKFEAWKSKSYALSVPLKIIALQGSMPPSWVKDFFLSQGKRARLQMSFRGTLDEIFSELSMPFTKKGNNNVKPSSAVAADVVSIGDSWLSFAIKKAIIEPISGVEELDWFKALSPKWKIYLRRNRNGDIDPEGDIWAAPYRWGTMVIAYKKSKFQKHNLAPIEDWADLWRPELAGKISMVNSPREVVGAVLKYMGASYNTPNVDLQVAGGRNAVQQNLALLGKQVRLFDSVNYLKAFSVGDVWVAVGCSSDVLLAAKRMSNVAVIVPKSGSNLWADLWAIPAASRLETTRIGGRVRGPSPLIHQWIEFCLQAARVRPFKQGVTAGASPSSLESAQLQFPVNLSKGEADSKTDQIGVPPPEILAKCEFLEPLSEATLSDYRWLIASIQKPGPDFIHLIEHQISYMFRSLWLKLTATNR